MTKLNPEFWPDIGQLKTFIELAENADLQTTAARRYISAEQLLDEIKALEQLFGVGLFVVHNDSYNLTNAGLAFVEQAHLILAHYQRIQGLRDLTAPPQPPLSIRFPAWLPHTWLVSLLNQLRNQQPDLMVNCLQDRGKPPKPTDLVINFSKSPPKSDWTTQPWQMLPLVKASHPSQANLPPAIQGINCLFDLTGEQLTTNLLSGESLVIQALVEGLGWAIVPRACIADHLVVGTLVDWQEPIEQQMVYWHTGPTFPKQQLKLMDTLLSSHQSPNNRSIKVD